MISKITRKMARYILSIDDLGAWLGDESGRNADIIMAMRNGDESAKHMFRCVMDNDARALRRAAKQYAAE